MTTPRKRVVNISDRIPRNRLPLSDAQLHKMVEQLTNYEPRQAQALLLLIDEIEASQFDRLRIDSICLTVSQYAYMITGHSDDKRRTLVEALRGDFARTRRKTITG